MFEMPCTNLRWTWKSDVTPLRRCLSHFRYLAGTLVGLFFIITRD